MTRPQGRTGAAPNADRMDCISSTNPLHLAALDYAARGWAVLPLEPQGKAPLGLLVPHGLKDATTDVEVITAWWARRPDANVGLLTGEAFDVLDVDGEEGRTAFLERCETEGFTPASLVELPRVVTGRGTHVYGPPTGRGNSTGILPHVDWRGQGGYVVAPPSIHENGNVYEWKLAPNGHLPEWPAFIPLLLAAPHRQRTGNGAPAAQDGVGTPYGIAALERELAALLGAVVGTRNDTLNATGFACYQLVAGGELQEAEVTRRLTAAGLGIGLDADEVERTLQSARDAGFAEPRSAPAADPVVSSLAPQATAAAETQPEPWPILPAAALHGFVGDFVKTASQYTEADPVAVLGQCLALAGAVFGRYPHATAGNAQHAASLFVVIVGNTSSAGKGTSFAVARSATAQADSDFVATRIMGGFGSGEALVDEVADADENTPAGDTRLVVHEAELIRILKVASREGSILGSIIHNAWDGVPLQARTRRSKIVASSYHVGAICHVTLEELRAKLPDVEVFNGFGNRFLWMLARRAQRLPMGGNVPPELLMRYGKTLTARRETAADLSLVCRTPAAEERWAALYDVICDDEPAGVLGAAIARAAPYCLRLSLLYALLDGSRAIDVEHVDAAWALWSYCRRSAGYIFGRRGEDISSRVLAAVQTAGAEGMTRTQLRDHFQRNEQADDIDRAVKLWERAGLLMTTTEPTGGPGRPPRLVRAVP